MPNKILVIATIQIPGIHQWSECPIKEVEFLKDPHRHLFKITVKQQVKHTERAVEIILLGQKVGRIIKTHFPSYKLTAMVDFGNMSCEALALFIHRFMPDLYSCEVLEDGENGSEVIFGA